MRRAAVIFIASIILPSLVLAWMAVRSAQDQQVVLEHQQVIITQNITDAVARSVQGQMDQQRADFVSATQQILAAGLSPQVVADDFNRRIRTAWPMAEVGFAVDLGGRIYSPQMYEGAGAKIFRNENDRFLSNLENVAVYNSKGSNVAQNDSSNSNSALQAIHSLAQFEKEQQQSALRNANEDQHKMTSLKSLANGLASPDQTTPVTTKSEAEHTTASASDIAEPRAAPPADKSAPAGVSAKMSEASLKKGAPTSSGYRGSASSASGSMGGALPEKQALAEGTMTATSQPNVSDASPAPQATSAPTLSTSPPPQGVNAAAAAPSSPPPASMNNLTVNTNLNTQNASTRNVIPQQQLAFGGQAIISNSVAEQSDFRRVIGSDTSGELARFLDNKLRLLVWSHPDGSLIYGAQLDSAKLVAALQTSFQIPEMQQVYPISSFVERATARPQYCVAILDDLGHPIALSIANFSADWKHPFVSTEIGDALPHWEAALYLVNPQQFGHEARVVQFTIALIVLVLVAAIAAGGWLISADVRRQVRLAQQKTDFVSNVSHELKTPLTSIRMFADLLAEKRVPDEERQATYLRIIAAEASRLTRLINNVLDFARLEKGKPPGEHHDCDLAEAARDVAGTCKPHLDAGQIKFQLEVESEPLPIRGDRDALAQIILNLISNAEKYGGSDILVRVRRQDTPNGAFGYVDVLDRGAGIPPREAKVIFEPFHRLEESLSGGIPGTGLGLTLARRMARTYGGDVTYSARAGGGSCFTLSVPLARA